MTDSQILIRPTEFRDYLKSLGWEQVTAAVKDDLYVLNSTSLAEHRQIVFPTDFSAPDYFDAIQISLLKLEKILDLDWKLIQSRVRNVASDVLKFRVLTRQEEASVSLESAGRYVAAARRSGVDRSSSSSRSCDGRISSLMFGTPK